MINTYKLSISLLKAALMVALCMPALLSAQTVTVDNIQYKIDTTKNTATCTGPTNNSITKVNLTIPDEVQYQYKKYPVTEIGSYAFYDCSGLTGSLTIGKNVQTIGSDAFGNCSGFNGTLTIGENVQTIGSDAFYNCSGFNGPLVIPNSVTKIGNRAFEDCSSFNGPLVIPNSITQIGESAFSGCSGFKGSLIIPNSVTQIGNRAFRSCSGFNGPLVIPNSVTEIGTSAFWECSGFNESLTIGDNVQTIGQGAFFGCSGFTGSLIIPNSVIEIGVAAFASCSGFTGSLTIGENVQTIGNSAFLDCSNLTSIYCPASLKQIGYLAMSAGPKLETVYCYAPYVPEFIASDMINGYNHLYHAPMTTTGTLYVPAGSEQAYRNDPYWGEAANIRAIPTPVDGVEISVMAMDGSVDRHDFKAGENFYLTATLTPEGGEFEKVNWTCEPADAVDFNIPDEIVTGTPPQAERHENKGLTATATVREGFTGSVTITATVDETEITDTYTITVSGDILLGDANDNGSVTLADVITIANEILAQNSGQPSINKNFCFINADVDKNLRVDIIDQNATTNIAMGLPPFPETASALAAAATTTDMLTADSFTAGDCAIGMRLDNAGSYVGLQADILLPRGMEVTAVTPAEGVTDHMVGYSISPDNRLRVLVYSLQNSSFAGNGQALFTVHGTAPAGCGSLAFGDIIAVDTSTRGHRLEGRGGSGDGTTAIGSITGDDNGQDDVEIYDLLGRRVQADNLKGGIYIFKRGEETRKVLVK